MTWAAVPEIRGERFRPPSERIGKRRSGLFNPLDVVFLYISIIINQKVLAWLMQP